jgi:hypothetical protein
MKITKTQLQNIIREELDALSEDEQLDEFFGPFSAKARRKKKRDAMDKKHAEREAWMDVETGGYWDTEEGKADSARTEKEIEAKRAARKAKQAQKDEWNRKANKRASDEKFRGMVRGTDPDSPWTKEKIAKKGVGGVGRGGMRSSNYNRKDESKVRQRIREEVSKAVKAHFKK